ncbi:MAG: glycosyltransferase family 4 protein [Alphaproteobacteria bacterium]
MQLVFAIKSLNVVAGGAERVLVDVTGGLSRRGHDITVVTFDQPGGESRYPLDPSIHRVDLGIGAAGQRARVVETLKRTFRLRRVITDLRPDAVVAFMHSMFIPMGVAMLGSGVPVIASEHDVPALYARRPLDRLLLHFVPQVARTITVPSPGVRDSYPPYFRRHMVPIANPVTLAPGVRADPAGAGAARKVILSIGRLSEQKDQATLIDAFALLATEFPDWDVRIAGEGELRPMLEAKIAAHRLGDRIALLGSVSAIEREYAAAQIYAHPALYESFGLVVAEALGYGLPVAAFADCLGAAERVRDRRNGMLVSGTDRACALADALRRLMSDAALRVELGEAGTASVQGDTLGPVTRLWEDLLQNTIARTEQA